MSRMNFVLLFLFVGSIGAANFRDLSKRVMVGSILGYAWMNDTTVNKKTGEMFNLLTCENEMKWEVSEPHRGKPNYERADLIVQYAQQHKMKLRGHTLVWYKQAPQWVNQLNKTDLHSAMITRIKNLMTRYKGKIYGWDVVNEAMGGDGGLRNCIWTNYFGETYISEAFKLARQVDPSTKLYINDFGTESNNTKTRALFNLVKKLKGQGVPIDGVGFQGHFTAGKVPSDFENVLRWFTTLGVEVAVTELDIGIKDTSSAQLEQQAKDYAAVYKACQDVSKCVSVTAWGFTDKYSWLKRTKPCMWDENFNPKPAVAAVEAVLKN